jgi:hypothetical protein
MSVINNDVGTDQLFLSHPHQLWTRNFISQIKSELAAINWVPHYSKNFHAQVRSNSYQEFVHKKFNNKIIVNLVHNAADLPEDSILVTDVVTGGHKGPLLRLYPEVFGIYHTDFNYENKIPTKKFNCFIHRADPFRQSWFYQLARHKLLDHGHISYWAHDRFGNRTPEEYYEFLYHQNNQIFQQEHTEARGKIPFKNFDFCLEHAIMDSEISVVLDTFFEPNGQVSYSEKVWRAIQMPRPWLLFSSRHAVKNLREWGFDVFDDYVDHSYDNESDPVQRQIMILNQLENPIRYTMQNLLNFVSRAQLNSQLLIQYQQEWPNKYKKITLQLSNITNTESFTIRT